MTHSSYHHLLNRLQAWRFHPCAALVYIDVRHMRALNRYASPLHGDQVLSSVMQALNEWVGGNGIAGKLWSNEFVAVRAIDHAQTAVDAAEQLRDRLSQISYPSLLGNNHLGVAIGLIVAMPQCDWNAVISSAGDACNQAKRRGINQVMSHVSHRDDASRDAARANLVINFRRLMAENRLVLHAQPIMDITHGQARLAKAEFLIRQQQDDAFITLPPATIETLENLGLATELDRFSSQFALEWMTQNGSALRRLDSISLNLSAQSIGDGHFIDSLYRDVKSAELPPGQLCFEITETAAIKHLEVAAEFIADFRSIGCRFSLDDFGSGLCSFGYLQSLAVDEVKIDGRFTRDLVDNPVSQEILRAIQQVAHATGKKTVAEFVDDPRKLALLRDIGVDYAQGWLFSPAIPPDQLLRMLHQQIAA